MPLFKHQIVNIIRKYCADLDGAGKKRRASDGPVKRKRDPAFEALDSEFGAEDLADYLAKEINILERR